MASGGADDRAFLWRVSIAALHHTRTLLRHLRFTSQAASPQAGAEDGYTCELRGHTDTVSATAFSSDGSLLATAGLDGAPLEACCKPWPSSAALPTALSAD